jgi:hypothetical protein
LVSFVAFFPIAFCSGLLSVYLHREWVFIAGGALSFTSMFAASMYLLSFRCPRCGSLFFFALYPKTWRAAFSRACAHCGLHTYASQDDIAKRPNQTLQPTAGRSDV